MGPEHVDFGLELCRIAGWNQLPADWRRLMGLSPGGMFVAIEDGRLAGTASVVSYGRMVGWIGMILVHPDFRGRGIGSTLMRTCIDTLRSRGVATIKLDATDQGRPVYLKLGFIDERPIWRMQRSTGTQGDAGVLPAHVAGPAKSQPGEAPTRPVETDDWPAISNIDAVAFGADRTALLRHLAGAGTGLVFTQAGQIQAYGFYRRGFRASHIGPIVASAPAGAESIVGRLLDPAGPGSVFWDLFPENNPARELAESLGFSPIRKLTRMYLDEGGHDGDISQVFAAAGFEIG